MLLCNYSFTGLAQRINTGLAQRIKPSFGVDITSSGNYHPAFTSPQVSLGRGGDYWSTGVLMTRDNQLRGFRVRYTRDLFYAPGLEQDPVEIYGYVQFQKNGLTPLSESAIRYEEKVAVNKDIDWSKVQLSTCQVTWGLQLQFNLFKRIAWKNTFSGGYYYHDVYQTMDHTRSGFMLSVSTGVWLML